MSFYGAQVINQHSALPQVSFIRTRGTLLGELCYFASFTAVPLALTISIERSAPPMYW